MKKSGRMKSIFRSHVGVVTIEYFLSSLLHNFFARHYSQCVKQPMCFLLDPIKPKNPSQLTQSRQGCGLVAKNTEESCRATAFIKGRAEEEGGGKKRNKREKTPRIVQPTIPWQQQHRVIFK